MDALFRQAVVSRPMQDTHQSSADLSSSQVTPRASSSTMPKRSSTRGVDNDDDHAPLAPATRMSTKGDNKGAAPPPKTKRAQKSTDSSNAPKPPTEFAKGESQPVSRGPKEDVDDLKPAALPKNRGSPTDAKLKEVARSGRTGGLAVAPSDGMAAAAAAAAAAPQADDELDKVQAKIAAMDGHGDETDTLHPGAVAMVPSPASCESVSMPEMEEDEVPADSEESTAPTVSTDKAVLGDNDSAVAGAAITAQLVPDDKDVEAQFNERVRRETENIANVVQRRILNQAAVADVMDSSAEEPPSKPSRNWKRWIIIGGIVLLLIVVGVVVGVLVGGSSDSDDSTSPPAASPTPSPTVEQTLVPTASPTAGPTLAPTGEVDVLQVLLEEEFESEIVPGTPQDEALQWIANVDPLQLTVDTPIRLLRERYAVAVFYFALAGEGWTNDFGFLGGSSLCTWNDGRSSFFGDGVFCDSNDSVSHIRMQANNLDGSLPDEITALRSLEVLDIQTNTIQGPIPASFGDLVSLETLNIAENFLTGILPESVFDIPSLEKLYLFRNRDLGGTLPTTIGTIGSRRLAELGLINCQLSGELPSALADLVSLEFLSLAQNSFVGSIPAFNSASLREIYLFENDLSGEIPSSIGELPNLQRIALADNGLSGPIPLFTGSTSITDVLLYGNQLTGVIEEFLFPLQASPNLGLIHIGSNNLGGSVPDLIGSFTSLKTLNFENNILRGVLPSEIGLLTALTSIDLFEVQVEGPMPSEIGQLTALSFLDLGSNRLSGTNIPPEVGNMLSLEVLNLSFCMLSAVPTEIAALPALEFLWLHGNQFEGSLNPFFCERSDPIDDFWGDCLGPIPDNECSCCTSCCASGGLGCQDVI